MSCDCNNPRDYYNLIDDIEDDENCIRVLKKKCVGVHPNVDGYKTLVLIGLSAEDKEVLVGCGWVQIKRSYMWVKE